MASLAGISMAGVVPCGAKAPRGVNKASAKAPARASAHMGSAFMGGSPLAGRSFEGQQLSVGVAPAPRGGRGSRCVTTAAAKIAGYIKLAIEAGKANPAPPIGPALGAKVRASRQRQIVDTRRPNSPLQFTARNARLCKAALPAPRSSRASNKRACRPCLFLPP